MKKKLTSLILAVLMLLQLLPVGALAAVDPSTSLCEHHQTHEGCGYTEGSPAVACTHGGHTDECYEVKCNHVCTAECVTYTLCTFTCTGEADCLKTVPTGNHDESCNTTVCSHVCGETCADPCTFVCTGTADCLKPAIDCKHVEGVCQNTLCSHVHDDICREEIPCGFVCTGEDSCLTKTLICGHAEDGSCCAKEEVAAAPCEYECQDCAAAKNPCTCAVRCEETADESCQRCVADLTACVGMTPISSIAADTGGTYTLTIKYDFTNPAGTSFNTGTSDKVITGLAPGTVVDLSDHWPDTLTTNGSDGKTYYLGGFKINNSSGGSVYDAWEVTGDQTLYASWTITHQITVTFDANGGSYKNKKIRRTGNFDIYSDLSVGFAEYYTPTREGYKFLGWALNPNGPAITSHGTTYNEGDTLYAIWEELPSIQVGQVALKSGEYTTNGRSSTTTKPESGGYAHFENGVLTLNNFSYTGNGVPETDVIYAAEAVEINVVGTNTINATDACAMNFRKGYVIDGNGVLNLTGTPVCILGNAQYPAQIKNITLNAVAQSQVLNSGQFSIENAKLNLTSEDGSRVVRGGTVVIKNSEIVSNAGIAATLDDLEVENSKIVVSEDVALSVNEGNAVKLIGGNITISGSDEEYGAIYVTGGTLTLPAVDYWWRTSADGAFTKNGFVYNKQAYIEITTTEPHIHSYTRKTNDTQHWMECTCGTVQEGSLEDHKGGTATCTAKARCSDCSEEYGDYGAHNWHTEWTTDSEKHWHKCLNTDCTEVDGDNLHSGGTATCMDRAKCEICDMVYGAADGDNHAYSAVLTWNDGEHYYECSRCHEKKDKAAHDYDNGYDTACNTCGYVRILVQYAVTSGANQTVTKGDTASFTVNIPFTEFKGILVDGETVSSGSYTASATRSGYTKITLGSSYIRSLRYEEYRIAFLAEDGYGAATFKVKARPVDSDSPQTGDITQSGLWITLAGVGLLGMIGSMAAKKHSRKRR